MCEESMINIFVTYRCNLACPYCFARELHSDFPADMELLDFHRLLKWMIDTGISSAALIGGEPTLHPEILTFIREMHTAGITIALFTNGLFAEDLAGELALYISNFVINYNEADIYSLAQHEKLHKNLNQLVETEARITFSKNFSLRYKRYDYLLDGALRYGVKDIRYDISRPSRTGRNDFLTQDNTKILMKYIVSFVRECEGRGIRTGLDCCLKLCDLSGDDRSFLERVSVKLRGICHPSIDIHPDLSASYCLPLQDVSVKDVTIFANRERLMHHFAATVRPMRFENVSAECLNCHDFRKKCQGGCMATKRLANSTGSASTPSIEL